MKLFVSDVASPELGQINALQSLDWEDFTAVELGNNGSQRFGLVGRSCQGRSKSGTVGALI